MCFAEKFQEIIQNGKKTKIIDHPYMMPKTFRNIHGTCNIIAILILLRSVPYFVERLHQFYYDKNFDWNNIESVVDDVCSRTTGHIDIPVTISGDYLLMELFKSLNLISTKKFGFEFNSQRSSTSNYCLLIEKSQIEPEAPPEVIESKWSKFKRGFREKIVGKDYLMESYEIEEDVMRIMRKLRLSDGNSVPLFYILRDLFSRQFPNFSYDHYQCDVNGNLSEYKLCINSPSFINRNHFILYSKISFLNLVLCKMVTDEDRFKMIVTQKTLVISPVDFLAHFPRTFLTELEEKLTKEKIIPEMVWFDYSNLMDKNSKRILLLDNRFFGDFFFCNRYTRSRNMSLFEFETKIPIFFNYRRFRLVSIWETLNFQIFDAFKTKNKLTSTPYDVAGFQFYITIPLRMVRLERFLNESITDYIYNEEKIISQCTDGLHRRLRTLSETIYVWDEIDIENVIRKPLVPEMFQYICDIMLSPELHDEVTGVPDDHLAHMVSIVRNLRGYSWFVISNENIVPVENLQKILQIFSLEDLTGVLVSPTESNIIYSRQLTEIFRKDTRKRVNL
ncbi:hypothetical protein SNEBB_000405 [Seison nebaliae]|nr:hypothetical protein SNEBB_000405 [Seison nebaliae]